MNEELLQNFAIHLKQIRERKNLSQDDIASEGISRSMISLVETARTDITLSKLKIIADNLGISLKELLDF